MVVLSSYARVIGLLIGARVDVDVTPASPLARLGIGRIDNLRLAAVPEDRRAVPFPMQVASVSGSDVTLGWKAPALLLAPFWAVFARPTLLPFLLLAWLYLPNSGRGSLEWECYIRSGSLERGAWRWMLGLVLDGIGRSSLPGMLATINPDGSTNPYARLPRSVCTGVSVAKGGKLVLNGQLQRFDLQTGTGAPGLGGPAAMGGGPPAARVEALDYTLRMGVRAGSVESDGTVVDLSMRSAAGMKSCLLWDTPELQLSLGDGPLARLLPKLWVPVAASTGVVFPRGLELRTATVSEAGDGVSASGDLALSKPKGEPGYAITLR